MNWLQDEQRRRNQLTQGNWLRFAAHRERVTGLLLEARRNPADRLGVLGAGNCNDLDLHRLLQHYREIHLLDTDPDALRFALQQQHVSASLQLHIHQGDDLTGILDTLASLERPDGSRGVSAAQCCDLRQQLRGPVDPRWVSDLDVVASTCTLTQLIDSVSLALGPGEQTVEQLALDVRDQHLRLMLSMLRPGGRGVLISDFVSSDSCPELPDLPLPELPEMARHWIDGQNFFTGTNPFAIKRQLIEECTLPVCRDRVEIIRPWKWDFGPRVYAVSAVRFERAGDLAEASRPIDKT